MAALAILLASVNVLLVVAVIVGGLRQRRREDELLARIQAPEAQTVEAFYVSQAAASSRLESQREEATQRAVVRRPERELSLAEAEAEMRARGIPVE